MTVRIYTMTHKKFDAPKNQMYVPLQVGRALNGDCGYLPDDTGENISLENGAYGELTGLYWVWKNDVDSDVIGICHYRRYFVNEKRELLAQKDYEEILAKYDVVVSTGMETDKSYAAYYGEAHNIQDLLEVGKAIEKLYPEDKDIFEEVISGHKYYYGNLCVMKRKEFMDYANWLFTILKEAEKSIDTSSYDLYNKRVFGFLSEELLLVWIRKRKLSPYECAIGITAEKAETVELKLAIGQLIKMRQIKEAREMFYAFRDMRPDICLELSDIKRELPIIEQLLYIMDEEKERNMKGLLSYSSQMTELIAHYHIVMDLLSAFSDGQKITEGAAYFKKTSVSWIMVMILILNSGWIEEKCIKAKKETADLYEQMSNKEAAAMLRN